MVGSVTVGSVTVGSVTVESVTVVEVRAGAILTVWAWHPLNTCWSVC